MLDQFFRTDQERISGERGQARIGRLAVAGGHQRQHLPYLLAGGGQKICETKCLRSEISDSKAARERSRMQQDAAGARKLHVFTILRLTLKFVSSARLNARRTRFRRARIRYSPRRTLA